MAEFWVFLFGEEDTVIVDEIAKTHKIDKEIVKKHYKKMIEDIKNEVQG